MKEFLKAMAGEFLSGFADGLIKGLFETGETNVAWKSGMHASMPVDAMQAVMRQYYCSQCGGRLVSSSPMLDIVRRGDSNIAQVTTGVVWQQIPVTISLQYRQDASLAHCDIRYAAPESLRFDTESVQHFCQVADQEFDGAFRAVSAEGERLMRVRNGGEASETSDFTTLGLKSWATWAEIQAAYRSKCKLYHPDTLTGKDLPGDLLDHAASRFKEFTDAYHRLKALRGD